MDKQIDILVRKFYAVADLAHISHVNVRGSGSYAAHTALGGFYDKVIDFKDRFIEYNMGEGRILKVSAPIIEVGEDIKKEADILSKQFCDYAKSQNDEALLNMAGEFEECVGKLKYLLMLQ